MSITDFFTNTITVKRMVYGGSDVGGDNNKSTLETQGTFKGHIQQADPELIASLAQTYKLDYLIWCSRDADVQVGDQLEEGSNVYTVMNIQDNTTGENTHYELHVRKA